MLIYLVGSKGWEKNSGGLERLGNEFSTPFILCTRPMPVCLFKKVSKEIVYMCNDERTEVTESCQLPWQSAQITEL